MRFYFPGWHQINNGESGCKRFERCLISVNRLLNRQSSFEVQNWGLDAGSFTRLVKRRGHLSVKRYAAIARRWKDCGKLLFVVAQDYLCVPQALESTGLTVQAHQQLTIHRYDRLNAELAVDEIYVMPVLQGSFVLDYIRHIEDYGDRLQIGQWIGVGSLVGREVQELVGRVNHADQITKARSQRSFWLAVSGMRSPVPKTEGEFL